MQIYDRKKWTFVILFLLHYIIYLAAWIPKIIFKAQLTFDFPSYKYVYTIEPYPFVCTWLPPLHTKLQNTRDTHTHTQRTRPAVRYLTRVYKCSQPTFSYANQPPCHPPTLKTELSKYTQCFTMMMMKKKKTIALLLKCLHNVFCSSLYCDFVSCSAAIYNKVLYLVVVVVVAAAATVYHLLTIFTRAHFVSRAHRAKATTTTRLSFSIYPYARVHETNRRRRRCLLRIITHTHTRKPAKVLIFTQSSTQFYCVCVLGVCGEKKRKFYHLYFRDHINTVQWRCQISH